MIDWEWLTKFIPKGRDNAISAEALSSLLGRSERDLRHIIEAARNSGILICSDAKGYFFSGSLEEMLAYISQVRARVRAECCSLAPFIRKIKQGGGNHDRRHS